MTTTKLFSGFNEDDRNSSRVLAPPGGKSNNIFGVPEPVRPHVQTQPRSDIFNTQPQSGEAAVSCKPAATTQAPFACAAVDSPTQKKEEDENKAPVHPAQPQTTTDRLFGAVPADVQIGQRAARRKPPGGESTPLW
jgi:hypothetical protein